MSTPDTKNLTLGKMMDLFDTSEECRTYLEELRWPEGLRCPRCNGETISRIKARSQFDCDGCRYQFSVTSGTIFHDSHLPLPKWFAAIYLMSQAKKGVSALQLKRTLGMSYKTAWYLCHRVRAALKNACGPDSLRGTVEVDETYIGGKAKGRGRGFKGNKTMILGAVERRGGIRLKVGKRATTKAIAAFMKEHVAESAHMMTDEWLAYRRIGAKREAHSTVHHRTKEWKRGYAHTNTIEGAFSLFKRSVVGSYHHLSVKHLPAYLDEFEFRYSNRENPFLFRDMLLCLIAEKHVTYKRLTA